MIASSTARQFDGVGTGGDGQLAALVQLALRGQRRLVVECLEFGIENLMAGASIRAPMA